MKDAHDEPHDARGKRRMSPAIIGGDQRTRAMSQLVGIGIAVMSEPDLAALLERIVHEARRLTNAESATLYVREANELRVVVVQNDRLAGRLVDRNLRMRQEGPPLALDSPTLPAHTVRCGEMLNVPDVYLIPGHTGYTFDRTWDRKIDYRTQSALLLPLIDRAGYTLGVLELSNALDDGDNVTVFDLDAEAEQLVRAFAAQAAVAIENSRLRELSFVDSLTGAYNRRFFMLRLEQEIKRHTRYEQAFGVALFDVDNFKPINDRFGHPAGDGTLTTVSRLLSAQSRGFTVIARLGGDEFGAVLPQTPKTGCGMYAERMRKLIEAYPFPYRGVTLSVGVACFPDDFGGAKTITSEEITAAADRALYVAKRRGRNQVALL
jgi:diguanylate cyclase (GGDEF)-like protein